MRKTAAVAAILIILTVGYATWPFLGLFQLARAVEDRDGAAISRQVDFRALRQSLTEQIMETYVRLTGTKLSPLTQGLVLGAVSTIADPIVEQLSSPEAFAELLRNGWPTGMLPDRPNQAAGIPQPTLAAAWQLFLTADYGLGRFSAAALGDRPEAQRFRIGLAL